MQCCECWILVDSLQVVGSTDGRRGTAGVFFEENLVPLAGLIHDGIQPLELVLLVIHSGGESPVPVDKGFIQPDPHVDLLLLNPEALT